MRAFSHLTSTLAAFSSLAGSRVGQVSAMSTARSTPAFEATASAGKHLLTPERLIEAPQVKNLAASPDGRHALIGVDRYSLKKKEKSKQLYVVDVGAKADSQPALLTARTSKALWLNSEEYLYIDDESNTLYAKHISDAVQGLAYTPEDLAEHDRETDLKKHGNHVGIFPTKVESMKLVAHSDHSATLVFSAQVYADGDLTRVAEHEKSDEVKEWNDVRVYESGFVRHWDKWLYPGKRSQLFSIDLERHGRRAQWAFASHYRNLLSNTVLESPVPPFGDEGNYDVSNDSVIFTSRDPNLNPAWHTRQNIYLAPLRGGQSPKMVSSGEHGATDSPAFSPKGEHAVWLQMEVDGFEADRNRIVMQHLPTGTTKYILPDWQLSPASVQFSNDGKSLVGVVERSGERFAFTIALHRPGSDSSDDLFVLEEHEVVFLPSTGTMGSVSPLPSGDILALRSTLHSINEIVLISTKRQAEDGMTLTAFGSSGSSTLADVDFGAKPEHFTYSGANGRDAYGWLLKPPGFSEDESYPLLTLIHGGPESAWLNSWGLRWNAAAFAAQGFVTIALNPAGSTGYGQAYQEEILGQLGGAPYEDVVAGTRHILDTMKNVDPERSVAAGGSYGGFMVNWINGHNDDGLYKGLVNHDGIYSTVGMTAATEELYFPFHEMGGPLWGPARPTYEEWSPDRYAEKWRTPTLIIHGGNDFRLTESEAISTYNTLQNLGVPTRFLYFPKESHWVTTPKNSLRWQNEVYGWLKKYSQGSASDTAAGLVFQSGQ